eukprot:508571_1
MLLKSFIPKQTGFLFKGRWFSSTPSPKTGIVMLNMGGPSNPADTEQFLHRLFSDSEIITLGGGWKQKVFADFVSKRRAPKVQLQYEQIGGSPIQKYTDLQGQEMCKILDTLSPQTAPHKAYTCFRYIAPLTSDVLQEMAKDGVERAIAFSQYPQWCCNTSGSSYNHLWRELQANDMQNTFKWSIIDRWFMHEGYIDALIDRIVDSLNTKFTETQKQNLCLLFSAHSIPMKSVQKGDPYVFEVATTVKLVMDRLAKKLKNGDITIDGISDNSVPHHQLSWQSKVGFLPWMTPSTEAVVKSIGENKRYDNVLVIPFVFTSDHIETLYELDVEYKEVAKKHGIKHYVRCDALNESKTFINGLANIVKEHIDEKVNYSDQYKLRCHNCTNDSCRCIVNPAHPLHKHTSDEQSKDSKPL